MQWDDKITTLPGLYFISIGILTPLSKVYTMANFSQEQQEGQQPLLCSVRHLRTINLVVSIITVLILNKLTHQIHGNKHVSKQKQRLYLCTM